MERQAPLIGHELLEQLDAILAKPTKFHTCNIAHENLGGTGTCNETIRNSRIGCAHQYAEFGARIVVQKSIEYLRKHNILSDQEAQKLSDEVIVLDDQIHTLDMVKYYTVRPPKDAIIQLTPDSIEGLRLKEYNPAKTDKEHQEMIMRLLAITRDVQKHLSNTLNSTEISTKST